MSRVYRLLRNNKEEGPFTAEELIEKNLRPYDLIWVDGRSAAWSYPGELAQFKKYVPMPGEEPVSTSTAKAAVSASVQAAIAVNNNIPKPEAKEKPRYKISAAWNKIQTITKPVVDNPQDKADEKNSSKRNLVNGQSTNLPGKSLSWEEAWLDWKEEKKPVTVKSSARTQRQPGKKAEPVLETKYAEPLDSLKDKYIENLLQQKQRSKKSLSLGKASEFILPTLALIVIFSAAYWFLHDTNTNMPEPGTGQLKQQPASLPASDATSSTNIVNDSVNTTAQVDEPATQNIDEPQPAVIEHAAERKSINTQNSRTPVIKHPDISKPGAKAHTTSSSESTGNHNNAQPVSTKTASAVNNPASNTAGNTHKKASGKDLNTANNAPVRNSTNTTTASTPEPSQPDAVIKKSNEKTTASYINVPEYIQMNDGSANIKIRNVSDIDLDLVVVDVQYYDASNRFRKGETMYLHNLKAGRDVIIKTPKDTNSLYATSKISLISSDAKQVYVIGDN